MPANFTPAKLVWQLIIPYPRPHTVCELEITITITRKVFPYIQNKFTSQPNVQTLN